MDCRNCRYKERDFCTRYPKQYAGTDRQGMARFAFPPATEKCGEYRDERSMFTGIGGWVPCAGKNS